MRFHQFHICDLIREIMDRLICVPHTVGDSQQNYIHMIALSQVSSFSPD